MSCGYKFAIDRGGTFTDIWAMKPNGNITVTKLLSEDPSNYKDAPTEGIRRILALDSDVQLASNELIDASNIDWIRMGTTVATNALLEKKGEKFALAVTKGFKDLYLIGDQTRLELFNLKVADNTILYEEVIEIDERLVLQQDGCQLNTNKPIIETLNGQKVQVWTEINRDEVKNKLEKVYAKGIKNLAVAFLHSYLWDEHEKIVGEVAKEIGFDNVVLSSLSISMPKMLHRGSTACVNSYLTPCLARYVDSFFKGFKNLSPKKVLFMQSNGGLTNVENFSGSKAIISGPAGGVVGCSMTTPLKNASTPVIGFDMGGTSTDVSRYAGLLEEVMESNIGSVKIMTAQLDIKTVAAGGGSILSFRSGLFYVGPESAGAHPGPMSYRKNGPLTITDANLLLGRLQPSHFPMVFGPNEDQSLDLEAVHRAFEKLTQEINVFNKAKGSKLMTSEEVALGFIAVANESMCRPIRNLTEAKGFNTSDHVLNCFGGAAGQHACAIAKNLNIETVFIHKHSSLLSAYGMALADVVVEHQLSCTLVFNAESYDHINKLAKKLIDKCILELKEQLFPSERIQTVVYLHLRFENTEYSLICTNGPKSSTHYDCAQENIFELFNKKFEQEFGFLLKERAIVVDSVRVKALGKSIVQSDVENIEKTPSKSSRDTCKVFYQEGNLQTPIYKIEEMDTEDSITGPALLIDNNSTILIEPTAVASFTKKRDISITIKSRSDTSINLNLNPVHLSLFSNRFMSIAEQMGRILQRTAISTNIKERLDFSCALFSPDGGLVSNAPHIPVHLGSMQQAVQYQVQSVGDHIEEGDVILSNHPSAGGSHLPDLTVITPVFHHKSSKPVFFVASRGHHADIGGSTPGSMPSDSKSIHEEGAVFKSFFLVKKGVFNETELVASFNEPSKHPGCSGSRNLKDNISDLHAQIAANKKGQSLMLALIESYGLDVVQFYMKNIQLTTKYAVCDMMKRVADGIKSSQKVLHGEDKMDQGFDIKLTVTINDDKTSKFDFTGSSCQVYSNINAPKAITYSAIIYCIRCMLAKDIPLNQGCLEPIEIIIPDHSILNPSEEAAVVGGNVLTSQRLVDVIFKTFAVCSASQGCMNNISFGDKSVGYYETVAGGSGAGPGWNGRSGVHSHMTNTRITDVEVMEKRYPVIIEKFSLNNGSGGEGKYKGGDGVERRFLFRRPLTLSVLSERRVFSPYGLEGGGNGKCGENVLLKGGLPYNLGGKCTIAVQPWNVFVLKTPGGGGYGKQ